MKLTLNTHSLDDTDADLMLQAESAADRALLARLNQHYRTVGCGVDPTSGDLWHVRLPLSRLDESSHIEERTERQ